MEIGRNNVAINLSIREAQSLLIVLRACNKWDNLRGIDNAGVHQDALNLQRELENLLLAGVKGYYNATIR